MNLDRCIPGPGRPSDQREGQSRSNLQFCSTRIDVSSCLVLHTIPWMNDRPKTFFTSKILGTTLGIHLDHGQWTLTGRLSG
ncbi:hypothetical protein GJ744_003602 [Endocarpon pusillum]|uniref:Uncharacterized protein n=1 Tax=Endocarpon pusillum TaxID=364733 RepID=A0A8H7DY36_9EURO|nr:hypothetical protein GJ744_003602 [Endocarpon pusillum]